MSSEKAVQPQSQNMPRFDELRDANGIRPAWRPLVDAFAAMPPAEFTRRREAVQAMIRDNGAAYNAYEVERRSRPWRLDITPFVMSAADWRIVEAGIIQRAELANRLLADIYGSQKLIAARAMPPHLVFGHPQFLRPLVDISPLGGVHLHLYSADLTRLPDGRWMVLSSGVDAPRGLGYALENRIAMGQSFSDLFGEMQVRRLAAFFNAYRLSVAGLAERLKGRAVLLTPGPQDAAYFEDAYLSHYLGLTLIEGEDLAVREGQVFLKTLTGLERVGAIFRSVESSSCDPLELRGDSARGIPGLVDAVRAGNVLVANALGGGVLESPAMDAHLPHLARMLLGEELRIAGVPAIWCGTEEGRTQALDRFDRVILRYAFDPCPRVSPKSCRGSEMSPAERQAFKDRLLRRGCMLVAEDIVPPGLAPVFEEGVFGSRAMSLRVFATWTPDGYKVMPGGLTRVTSGDDAPASKDAWVIGEGPADNFTLLRQPGRAAEIQRSGEAPPSRAMDNLFWLGRYAERTENLVRILRAVVLRLGEDRPSASAVAGNFLFPPMKADRSAHSVDGDAWIAPELHNAIYGHAEDGLQHLLARVHETGWAARDRLSADTWRAIHLFAGNDADDLSGPEFDPAEASHYLDMLIRRAAAFAGFCAENMTRGPNWLFTDLGRRVERLGNMARLVRETAAAGNDPDQIRVALEIADSAMTYRSRYLNQFELPALIDLLLFDRANPRSCIFQLQAIDANLRELPLMTPVQRRQAALEISSALTLLIDEESAASLSEPDETGLRRRLNGFAEKIEEQAANISSAISTAYFRHSSRWRTGAAPRQLV